MSTPPDAYKAGPADWAGFFILMVVWGSSFAIIDVAVRTISPEIVVALRLWIAALVLTGYAMATGRALPRLWPAPDRAWPYLLAIAALGNAIPFFLISWAQQSIESGLAGIVVATMPLLTAALAHLFVPGERLTWLKAAGVATGFSGVVILFGPTALKGGLDVRLLSLLGVLLAAFLYACTAVITRFSPHQSLAGGAAAICIAAAVMSTPFAILRAFREPPDPSAGGLIAVAALGLFPTALAVIVYLRTIRSAGPNFVAMSNYMTPVWAVALGAALLGERPGWNALAALILILAGLMLTRVRRRAKTHA